MTTLSKTHSFKDKVVWRPIAADFTFWGIAGGIVAATAAPLGDLFGIAPTWLAVVGGGFFVAAGSTLYFLNRARPVAPQLLWSLAVFNAVLAPVAWMTALFGWLPLTTAGNWGLAAVGDVALVFSIYQFNGLRLRRSAQLTGRSATTAI